MPHHRSDPLVFSHLPLVERIAGRVHRRLGGRVEHDELISLGTLGLIQAADRYDHRPETSFATYAYYRIQGAMLDGAASLGPVPRGTHRRRENVRVRPLLAEPADESGRPPDQATEDRQRASEVRRAFARLPERSRRLLFSCYYQGASLTDAGRELGVSKSRASRLHASALAELRQSLVAYAA